MTACDLVEMLLDEDLKSKLPYLTKQFPDLADQIENVANTVDPTPNKVYITWLLAQMRAGQLTQQNSAKVRQALESFNQYKRRPEFGQADINRFTVETLLAKLQEYGQGAGGEVAGEAGNLKVLKITTPEEAVAYSKGTGWCTKQPEKARLYLDRGPLYLVTKANRPYVLFQPGDANVRDVHNQTVSDEIAREIAPVAKFIPARNWAKLVTALEPGQQKRREFMLQKAHRNFVADHVKAGMARQDAEHEWKAHEATFKRTLQDDPDQALISSYQLGQNPNHNLYRNLGINKRPTQIQKPAPPIKGSWERA